MRILLVNLARVFLSTLADLEFDLLDYRGFNFTRKIELRLLRVQHSEKFRFGRKIMIRNRGNFKIGHYCCIGSYSRIWNYEPIEIGDNFIAGGGLTLNSAGHDPVTLKSVGLPIKIGDRVWCGVNVTILAGTTIGDDAVIGAGSLVNKDVPANTIVAGVPAKTIRDLDRNEEVRQYIREHPPI